MGKELTKQHRESRKLVFLGFILMHALQLVRALKQDLAVGMRVGVAVQIFGGHVGEVCDFGHAALLHHFGRW